MKKTAIISLAAAILCAACKPTPGPTPPPTPAKGSLWEMKNDLVETISIYNGKTLVQSFNFEYSDDNLLTRMTRVDEQLKIKLMDISYSYEDKTVMRANCKFLNATKTLEARFNDDRDNLEYGIKGGNIFSLSLDAEDLPGLCKGAYSYDGKAYSSKRDEKVAYSTKGGNISSLAISSEASTDSRTKTKSVTSGGVEYIYTYSDKADEQNFAALLMPCEMPVWVPAELPGCKNLVTGMTCKAGGVTLPESFTVSYELNDNGSIRSATRTDFSRGREVSSIRYEFSYL